MIIIKLSCILRAQRQCRHNLFCFTYSQHLRSGLDSSERFSQCPHSRFSKSAKGCRDLQIVYGLYRSEKNGKLLNANCLFKQTYPSKGDCDSNASDVYTVNITRLWQHHKLQFSLYYQVHFTSTVHTFINGSLQPQSSQLP